MEALRAGVLLCFTLYGAAPHALLLPMCTAPYSVKQSRQHRMAYSTAPCSMWWDGEWGGENKGGERGVWRKGDGEREGWGKGGEEDGEGEDGDGEKETWGK